MTKVLAFTPNYAGVLPNRVATCHKRCMAEWSHLPGVAVSWYSPDRIELALARHGGCELALRQEFDYIFWLDDDAIIDPKILPSLLKHDLDYVAAPYPMRHSPNVDFSYDIIKKELFPEVEIRLGPRTLEEDTRDDSFYRCLRYDELDQGLVEIALSGMHCTLMKTSVLTTSHTDKPTLKSEWEEGYDTGEEIIHASYFYMPYKGGEDGVFCRRLRDRGFHLWCDTDLWADHLVNGILMTRER